MSASRECLSHWTSVLLVLALSTCIVASSVVLSRSDVF